MHMGVRGLALVVWNVIGALSKVPEMSSEDILDVLRGHLGEIAA